VGDDPVAVFSKTDIDVIEALIDAAVQKAMKRHAERYCRMGPMTEVETMRVSENLRWVSKLRRTSESIGNVVLGLIVVTLTGGLLSALWVGLRAAFKGQ